jgi:hypothetical protein
VSANSENVPSRKPSYLRFTLRTLLITITGICIWLGIHTQRARWQAALVDKVEKTYGSVEYDYQFGKQGKGTSWTPTWLRKRLGDSFFHSLKQVHTRNRKLIPELAQCGNLEELIVWDYELTDKDLKGIAGHRRLRRLTIQSNMHNSLPGDYPDTTQIGDPSLRLIGELPVLEEAYVDGYHITDRGLADLAKSSSLRSVYVAQCDESVQPSACEPLRERSNFERLWIRKWVEHEGRKDVVKWGKW